MFEFTGIQRLIVGGEQFDENLAMRVYEKSKGQIEIYNEYGPTEATVGVYYTNLILMMWSSKNVLIGKPVDNTSIYILDINQMLHR